MKTRKPTPAAGSVAEFAELRAADVMSRELVAVRAGDSVEEVERVLADARISGVPVLDDDAQLLGVLSTKDLVRRRAEDAEVPEELGFEDTVLDADETEPVAYRRRKGSGLCAGDLMSTDVATVSPETSLVATAHTMVTREVHRVVVVERGRPVGIVTTMDLLRPLAGLPPHRA